MTQITYSFTEKKRIRKSFAKRASVLDVPFLLATQINSYADFLQAEIAPMGRKPAAVSYTHLTLPTILRV